MGMIAWVTGVASAPSSTGTCCSSISLLAARDRTDFECRGLDPIGEHAQEQPSRKMGRSNPAQVVSPLEAKLIRVEAGKARDRSVEGFAR